MAKFSRSALIQAQHLATPNPGCQERPLQPPRRREFTAHLPSPSLVLASYEMRNKEAALTASALLKPPGRGEGSQHSSPAWCQVGKLSWALPVYLFQLPLLPTWELQATSAHQGQCQGEGCSHAYGCPCLESRQDLVFSPAPLLSIIWMLSSPAHQLWEPKQCQSSSCSPSHTAQARCSCKCFCKPWLRGVGSSSHAAELPQPFQSTHRRLCNHTWTPTTTRMQEAQTYAWLFSCGPAIL